MIPDYFIALVKQYGNLVSSEEAELVIKQISKSLQLTLDQDSSKILFGYAPSYLKIERPLFFSHLRAKTIKYNHSTLISRIQKEQSLTDKIEANNRLRAYFMAIKVVLGDKRYNSMFSVLPSELKALVLS